MRRGEREESFIKALRKIGLTENQAKVYSFLLLEGTSTAKETSNATNLPVNRIYKVFEQLHELGLVRYEGKRPIKYSPVPPRVGLKALFVKRALELRESFMKFFEEIGTISDLLSLSHWKEEDILVLREKYMFLALLKDLMGELKEELLATFSNRDKWLLDEILSILTVFRVPRVRIMIPFIEWGNRLGESGAEARLSRSKVSAILMDGKRAAMVCWKGESPLMLLFLEPSTVYPIAQYLESSWLASIPMEFMASKEGGRKGE